MSGSTNGVGENNNSSNVINGINADFAKRREVGKF